MSKYHTRSGYEELLIRLSNETELLVHGNIKSISDYELLSLINFRIIKLDCIPLNQEELEMELAE